jgi:hypothetical protein
MKKNTKIIIIISAVALLLICGLFYVLRSSGSASIQVLFPSGGETLVTGSSQTLKWKTHKIPAADKIAVTIRRIPPPALPEEGQEFDPIIFTDLPNTGSQDWVISDMYPAGNYVLGFTSYASTPITNPTMAESQEFSITKTQLVGGDRDVHGCIGSAGYMWCEPKQKCLRIWEEKCFVAEEAALTQIFAAEHKETVAQTHVTLMKLENNFASGSISFGPTPGEGGAFLARLDNNVWKIDYEGNGSIDCVKIRGLGYPQDVLEGFCDIACTQKAKLCPDGSAVGRTGPNCEFALCPGEKEPK